MGLYSAPLPESFQKDSSNASPWYFGFTILKFLVSLILHLFSLDLPSFPPYLLDLRKPECWVLHHAEVNLVSNPCKC